MKIIISAFYFAYQTCTRIHTVFNPFAQAIFSLIIHGTVPSSGSSCK